MSLAASGDYVAAEDTLHQISNPQFKSDPYFISCLAKCQVMNDKADAAWKLRSSMNDDTMDMDPESEQHFLSMLANECFRQKCFLVAAKAFDALLGISENQKKRHRDDSQWKTGLKSSCVGAFRSVVVASPKTRRGRSERTTQKSNQHRELTEVLGIIERHSKHKGLDTVADAIRQWMNRHVGSARPGLLP